MKDHFSWNDKHQFAKWLKTSVMGVALLASSSALAETLRYNDHDPLGGSPKSSFDITHMFRCAVIHLLSVDSTTPRSSMKRCLVHCAMPVKFLKNGRNIIIGADHIQSWVI
jgi:hypothetical protein